MNLWKRSPDAELRRLLRRVAQRDKDAFSALYHALYPQLSRHLYRLIRRAEDVEELLNDVMWVVWEQAAEFRGEAQVNTWVLGIATLKSHRWWQIQRRQQNLLAAQAAELDVAELVALSPAPPADDHGLAQGLATLSIEHRETVELAYYFGYSCAEIGELMNCPAGTVKTRLHYARKRLKQFLDPFPLQRDEV
jgi:RNA polymerase sigma-70 factor (ECF subfamily)